MRIEMNRFSCSTPRSTLVALTALAALFVSDARLHSQVPAPVAKTPEQILTEAKAANAALLEKQKATLERLDALQKEAEQLRIFTKRG